MQDENGKRDGEPQFDPATWTPDKPWPKGYYKPVPGLVAAIERMDRAAGEAGGNPGFRHFFWGLVSLPSQVLGLGFVSAGTRGSFGLMHSIAAHLTPWPPLLFFALVLPSLLYAGIAAPPGLPFGRALLAGLPRALVLLAGLLLAALLLSWRRGAGL